jgi:hypothetical protein
MDLPRVLYNLPICIYIKSVVDRLTEHFDKRDGAFIQGINVTDNDEQLVRQEFIEACVIDNLTRAAETIAGDDNMERQRQLEPLIANSSIKASYDSEIGPNIW